MRQPYLIAAVFALGTATGCTPAITDCEPQGDIRPVCDMKTPEDIAAVPDGRHLLLAHFGHMGKGTGSISLFDTQTETLQALYPAPGGQGPWHRAEWGEPSCTEPPNASFGPHGTHLHRLHDGRWRYLVVNHGDREAVELFELLLAGDTPQLAWRGCVHAAPDTLMNDVVGLENGDLVYTRMFHVSDKLALPKSLLGRATGELWRWRRGRGLEALPATAAAMPNGLEISADNQFVYANMYMEGQVWQVRLADGTVVRRYDIASADNSAWGSDGRLWLASHEMGAGDFISCYPNPEQPCPGPFSIVALDPDTGESERLFHHEGPPMGAATVAVPQAGRVYMGSFLGDRMISVPDFGREQR